LFKLSSDIANGCITICPLSLLPEYQKMKNGQHRLSAHHDESFASRGNVQVLILQVKALLSLAKTGKIIISTATYLNL